jgi:hypothetical protein
VANLRPRPVRDTCLRLLSKLSVLLSTLLQLVRNGLAKLRESSLSNSLKRLRRKQRGIDE